MGREISENSSIINGAALPLLFPQHHLGNLGAIIANFRASFMKNIFIIFLSCILSTIFIGGKIQAPLVKAEISKQPANINPQCHYELGLNEYYKAYFYGKNRPDLARNKIYQARILLKNCGEESRELKNRVEALIKALSL